MAWLVAVPIIAGRMHGLAVLVHDFAHYRFIGNKTLSDWIGDVFLAWPVGATIDGYRRSHLAHHRYLNTDKDPDWAVKLGTRVYTFPQEMRFAILNFLGYLVALSSLRDIRMAYVRLHSQSWRYQFVRFGFYGLIGLILTLTQTWGEYLLYWAIPYFTFFFMFLYIRSVADHFGETLDYSGELTSTRTVVPFFWEYCFFLPTPYQSTYRAPSLSQRPIL